MIREKAVGKLFSIAVTRYEDVTGWSVPTADKRQLPVTIFSPRFAMVNGGIHPGEN